MTFNAIITTIKKTVANNLLFSILIIALLTILIIRALPENHLDMTSADTLNTARWWSRDGFSTHYFLHLRSGYGKIVRYLDDPELNDHARGNVSGSLGHHKIYGTHYPSMDTVPVAFLMKLGIEKIFLLRLPAIIASIFGLIFLYAFIKKLLLNKYIAFIAAAYFGVSPIFIKWADSMDFLPFGDFWSFLILLISLSAFLYLNNSRKSPKAKKMCLYLAVIWMSQLFLFSSSYHATFFIFTWLMGLTALYVYKNQNIKRQILLLSLLALFWASAPVFGFVIRMTQSVWYLGWQGAWLDVQSAFTAAGNRSGLDIVTRFEGMIKPFFSATGLLNVYTILTPLGLSKLKNMIVGARISTLYILPLLATLGVIIILKLKKIANYKIPYQYLVILLAAAPLVETFFLPFTGYRDNIGRLAAPFIGITIGIFIWLLFLALKNKKLTILNKLLFSPFLLLAVLLFIIQIVLNGYSNLYNTYSAISNKDISFAEDIKNAGSGEKAIFMINTSDTQIPEEELKKRWSFYDPATYNTNYMIWEYYFDAPLLNFTKTSYLTKDLLYLEKRSEYPFTAVITSDDKKIINELYDGLARKKLSLSKVEVLNDRYFFTVFPVVKRDF